MTRPKGPPPPAHTITGFDIERIEGGTLSTSLTLKDVARVAGVSPMTVSRALHRPDLVKPETIERVRKTVARMGYIPNQLAGGLASRKTKLVAAIVPQVSNSIYIETIQGLIDRLWDNGYHVLLGLSGLSDTREDELTAAILKRRPDGIMLTGINHTSATRQRLLAASIPVVETWDLTPTPIDMLVGFSHEEAGRSIARYLLGKGYRRFGLVWAQNERSELRRKGLIDELARHGITDVPVDYSPAPSTLQLGRASTAVLLDQHRLDAIICSSDALAQGALAEALSRGLQIPAQLGVMGFGDLDFAAHTFPTLSSVKVDGRAIGIQAADALLNKMMGRPSPTRVFDVGFQIIRRDSA